MTCAFASAAVFRTANLKAPSSSFVTNSIRTRRTTAIPNKRLRVSCNYNPDHVPDEIKALDELERVRRVNLSREPPRYVMKEETKRALLEAIPELAEIDRRLNESLQEDDYDPEDYRAYSWAFKKFRPWAPSPFLQALAVFSSFWFSRSAVLLVRKHISYSQMVTYSMLFDRISILGFAAVIPIILVLWTLIRNETSTDAFRRIAIMCSLSSLPLLAVSMTSSVGHVTFALVMGIVVRLLPMTISLWYWRDLRRQVFLSSTLLKRVFQVWRFLLTTCVILTGSVVRAAALVTGTKFSFASATKEYLFQMRQNLGSRFPVALSLLNDPRGLFFGASLILLFGMVYFLYFIMFVVNFFQIRDHRKTNSILTNSLVAMGIYNPNVHPNKVALSITAPSGTESYLPAPAMKLRKVEGVLGTDTSYLSNEGTMPLFSLLDKEAEFMAADGVNRWMKPRDELVPLSDDLTEGKRSTDALLSWACPLDDDQTSMSFSEFFETLEDDEYMYDASTGDWIFDKETDIAAGFDGQSQDADSAPKSEQLRDMESGKISLDEIMDSDDSDNPKTVFV